MDFRKKFSDELGKLLKEYQKNLLIERLKLGKQKKKLVVKSSHHQW